MVELQPVGYFTGAGPGDVASAGGLAVLEHPHQPLPALKLVVVRPQRRVDARRPGLVKDRGEHGVVVLPRVREHAARGARLVGVIATASAWRQRQ